MSSGTKLETASWHYKGTFGDLGPLTLEELEDLVDGGVIEGGTYVWSPALPSWLPAASVPELRGALARRAPQMEPPPSPGSMPPGRNAAPYGALPPALTFGDGYASPPQNFGTAAPHSVAGVPRNVYGPTYANPATLGVYGMPSDRSRVIAGILNLFLPGIGRMYLGYSALGVIQLVVTILTCGVASIWSVIDGVLILTGAVKIDGYGRILRD